MSSSATLFSPDYLDSELVDESPLDFTALLDSASLEYSWLTTQYPSF
jgi:hypothetical protein